VVGLICGDEELLREAVYGPKGYHSQLKGSLTSDGIWFEGTIAYHFYALQAMEAIVDGTRRVGWDLARDTRLREMFTGPMQMAYPNGQFPAINDGDYATLRSYRGHYRWAHRVFGDPLFESLAQGKANTSGLKSGALKGAGIVALRKGAGKKAVCVMLDYGEHGAHHGHPDKLNLMVCALGRELVPDPGRLTYSVPEHITWSRQTVAHSTVVVDGKSQKPREGELLFFEDRDEYAVCLATGGKSYPGVEQRRFLLATGDFLIDAFALKADREIQMDWILHGMGAQDLSVASRDLKTPLGAENGYQHLTELKQVESASAFHADWKQPGNRFYRVNCSGDEESELFIGNGIGYNLQQKVPFLIRRRNANAACFVTVHDLTGDGGWLRTLERLPVRIGRANAQDWEALGLRLEGQDGTYTVGVNFQTSASSQKPKLLRKGLKTYIFRKER